jgi:hypothetical protein
MINQTIYQELRVPNSRSRNAFLHPPVDLTPSRYNEDAVNQTAFYSAWDRGKNHQNQNNKREGINQQGLIVNRLRKKYLIARRSFLHACESTANN